MRDPPWVVAGARRRLLPHLRDQRVHGSRPPDGQLRPTDHRYRWQARCWRAAKEAAVSRRIRGASSRSSGPVPPCTSALLITLTYPAAAGSSRCSKVIVPSGTGHVLTQRRPGSTAVMVKGPPRLPRCLAQPRAPGSNGPSSCAISLLTSHSGQLATSVHTCQTASGSAWSTASHPNKYITIPAGSRPDRDTPAPEPASPRRSRPAERAAAACHDPAGRCRTATRRRDCAENAEIRRRRHYLRMVRRLTAQTRRLHIWALCAWEQNV